MNCDLCKWIWQKKEKIKWWLENDDKLWESVITDCSYDMKKSRPQLFT